jgi:hypothetical protein
LLLNRALIETAAVHINVVSVNKKVGVHHQALDVQVSIHIDRRAAFCLLVKLLLVQSLGYVLGGLGGPEGFHLKFTCLLLTPGFGRSGVIRVL